MVFLNGRFVSEGEARLSAFDAGVQHGVGLFETLGARVERGRAEVFELDEHLDRLIRSAQELGLSDALRKHALAEAVAQTVERAGHARARVRLTVTGGDLNLLSGRQGTRVDPTLMIVAQPATEYPTELFERGITVVIASLRVSGLDPMAGHKTLSYWARLRELRAAAERKAGEALVLQTTNHLAGGCVSNVFVVKAGTLLTPAARGEEGAETPHPVLAGVTRGWVMGWAADENVAVERRALSIEDLLGADEVFLTNSSFGVLPVVAVERARIAAGTVGELARRVRCAWAESHGVPAET
jgi:branched-subunit amino acid aminotransferase/4-amino-4-deoxychorismate lyase